MCGFLLRIIINAVVLFFAIVELPGIFVDTLGSTLAGAAIVGLANAAVRPLLTLASMPFDWLTVGGITFFTNLAAPLMVFKALPGFQISSVMAPLAGVLLITVCSSTLSKVIRDR
ncbi:hypothetical protein SDC9_13583 [bioreactor metagenome]|uniref:Phage holin family protein n=1 Tax=bioreactor metagenome TaxID=1076179 RepID=A0A644TLT5_9ZZZZ|nr:phage holin family protein [Negativicutes bacterium]